MVLPKFKIRASQISKIMGKVGLTPKQEETLKKYYLRVNGEGKPLTERQTVEYKDLLVKQESTTLPTACVTYLKEWYAEQIYQDREEIKSKYCDKGNMMEDSAIAFTGAMTGLFGISKNEEFFESEYIIGTPDIITDDEILDTKCSWNGRTFLESVTDSRLKVDYEWQMRGYMSLCGKDKARVCYCLMNTPEEANYGNSVSYSSISNSLKFYAKPVSRDVGKEVAIDNRVIDCRGWLDNYHAEVMGLLGV